MHDADEHGDYEPTDSQAFSGEAAERLRKGELQVEGWLAFIRKRDGAAAGEKDED